MVKGLKKRGGREGKNMNTELILYRLIYLILEYLLQSKEKYFTL